MYMTINFRIHRKVTQKLTCQVSIFTTIFRVVGALSHQTSSWPPVILFLFLLVYEPRRDEALGCPFWKEMLKQMQKGFFLGHWYPWMMILESSYCHVYGFLLFSPLFFWVAPTILFSFHYTSKLCRLCRNEWWPWCSFLLVIITVEILLKLVTWGHTIALHES